MRKINKIVVHCSATKEGQHVTAADIDKWHIKRGWSGIGYHYVILLDGSLEVGRAENLQGAHVKGHNEDSIGVCLIGGLDKDGKPKTTYTVDQFETLAKTIMFLEAKYPEAETLGHRDLSPDLDGDGVVEKHEWMKECPCMNVRQFVQDSCCVSL